MAFPLSTQKVHADPLSKGLDLAKVIAEGIDKGCDNLRESGNLQRRCKNGICATVACISFRTACDSPQKCKK